MRRRPGRLRWTGRRRGRVAFADGEGCRGFGGVGEAAYLGEGAGAVGVLDVAEHTTGTDGGELLVVADETYQAATVGDEPDRGRQVGGGRLGGFVDDDH